MRQSSLFTRSERAFPKDEISANAKFLERAGFVQKTSAGVYAYLPLGWRVMQRIADIIREEMNAIEGQELFLPALVEKKYWDATGRWDVEVGFRALGVKESKAQFTLGWSHEDILTAIVSRYIHSYQDLPFSAYQIQTKYRNEARAKSGLLRGREFMMKDLYSFHGSQEDFESFYKRAADAYRKIFARCGVDAIYTVAAGGVFTTEYTHEFQVACESGEDIIFVCEKCSYAENKEVSQLKNGASCLKCKGKVKEVKSIEVGNIFPLGTKYSEPLGLTFLDKNGTKQNVIMGSYGIGLGRLMGTIVEVHHDKNGILWPTSVAPFVVHLISLPGGDGESIYRDLQQGGIPVLYDDRERAAGEKFVEADLVGIPYRAVVSEKTAGKIELKKRNEKDARLVSLKELISVLNPSAKGGSASSGKS